MCEYKLKNEKRLDFFLKLINYLDFYDSPLSYPLQSIWRNEDQKQIFKYHEKNLLNIEDILIKNLYDKFTTIVLYRQDSIVKSYQMTYLKYSKAKFVRKIKKKPKNSRFIRNYF